MIAPPRAPAGLLESSSLTAAPAHSRSLSLDLLRTTTQNFCRNEYNVTGFCNRQSCPLANSRYATVREKEGAYYAVLLAYLRAAHDLTD